MPLNLKYKEKEHSEELKAFKEEMIKAIKEAEDKKQAEEKDRENKKKQRAASRIQEERKHKIKEIEDLITKKEIKVEELGKYSNFKEQINNLNKIWEIRSLAEQITNYIWKIINKKIKNDAAE